MSDAGSDAAPVADVPQDEVEVTATATEEKSGPMSVEDALQQVIKTAMVHDGLARGLRECAKALDKRQAHLCVLVETVTEGGSALSPSPLGRRWSVGGERRADVPQPSTSS